jgi:hypothetical protein
MSAVPVFAFGVALLGVAFLVAGFLVAMFFLLSFAACPYGQVIKCLANVASF